jgi:DNA helicase-2/ATP-dependent DNA helicase PcrA
MNEILDGLNPKQKEAAMHKDGPLLVLAGPGSGKTKTLTHRIAYLIANGISPYNILAVTFTNKAANEIKERVFNLLSSLHKDAFTSTAQPLIGTFHSICAKILRMEAHELGFSARFTIYDDDDQERVVKHILEETGVISKQVSPQKVAQTIANIKDELLDPVEYQEKAETPYERTVANIYPLYQEKLQSSNAMDFGDLLHQTIKLFSQFAPLLKKYQDRFQYILVDEYQDTNIAQWKLMNMLATPSGNLCVIGDEDQGIYGWRGADFRNILSFQEQWPGAKVVILDQNYRSTKTIVSASLNVIDKNTERKEKPLFTENSNGERIKVLELLSGNEEAEAIVEEMVRLIDRCHYSFRDFAVLYRMNSQSRVIEEAMLAANISYRLVGSVKFYHRKEIKDLIAYLRLVENPQDSESLRRIVNVPTRGIGPKTFEQSILGKPIEQFQKFMDMVEGFRKQSKEAGFLDLLKSIIKAIGFESYLRDGSEKGEERWENVLELYSVAQRYARMPQEDQLRTFLEEAALIQETDEINEKNNVAHLMTLHSAKGLEFPVVFIAGCEEGILPHERSTWSRTEMEEERRLCYVGMTRAKERLYLTFARNRVIFGSTVQNPPSSFIADIPEELVEFMSSVDGARDAGYDWHKDEEYKDDAYEDVSRSDFL